MFRYETEQRTCFTLEYTSWFRFFAAALLQVVAVEVDDKLMMIGLEVRLIHHKGI